MRAPSGIAIAIALALGACQKDSATGANGKDGSVGTTSDVVVTNETLTVEGTTRRYTLALPRFREPVRKIPLVLVFHGDGGDGPGMREAHTMDALSGRDAIIAYPTGVSGGWDLYEPSATNKDMKFVDALVASLATRQVIDRARVFGVGYSSGGYLVSQIACRQNGFFRGIVAHAAGIPGETNDPEAGEWSPGFAKCRGQLAAPEGGVAALSVMGDQDDAEGGKFIATYWASLNKCQQSLVDTTPSPCRKYDGCPAGKPVRFCLIPGLGHGVWDKGLEEGWSFIKSLL